MDTEREMIAGDDADLLSIVMNEDATEDAGNSEPEATENPAAKEEPKQQDRDERGRFVASDGQEPAEERQQPQTDPQHGREPGPPSYRLKEEADARRAAEERAVRAEQMLAMFQQQQHQQVQQSQPPQEPPDIFADPEAWYRYKANQEFGPILSNFQAQLLENSKAVAIAVHGAEAVSEAEREFNDLAARNQVDPSEYHRIVNSPNRYQAAVEWHKKQNVLKETGGDLKAFRERILSDAMSDPAFVARVIEAQRSGGTAPAAKPNTITRLPPSLSRTTGSPATSREDDEDMSDKGLLRSALSGR